MKFTVYSRANCQPCKLTKQALESAGASFDVIDLDQDTAAEIRVIARGIRAVPFVVVSDEAGNEVDCWSGLRPDRIKLHTKK